MQDFIIYVYKYFEKFTSKYGFKKRSELNEEQTYSIEYSSNTFTINIEKYRREFYVVLYKTNHSKDGINLFNLLEYLNIDKSDVPRSKYFREENDLNECYRKQLEYISEVIDLYFNQINIFFNSGDYKSKIADINRFMIEKNPELFKGGNNKD